jgi:hypothetical protein
MYKMPAKKKGQKGNEDIPIEVNPVSTWIDK